MTGVEKPMRFLVLDSMAGGGVVPDVCLLFERIRQQGSHIRFVHPDGRKTTIPDHGNKDQHS